jgi:hypothetical protein
MAVYSIKCYKCKHTFLFDGDHYEKETTTRLTGGIAKERIVRFCDNCSTPNMIEEDPHAEGKQIKPIDGKKASKDDVDMVAKARACLGMPRTAWIP